MEHVNRRALRGVTFLRLLLKNRVICFAYCDRDSEKADAEGHVREMEEAVLAQRSKFLAQLASRDREIQASVRIGRRAGHGGGGGGIQYYRRTVDCSRSMPRTSTVSVTAVPVRKIGRRKFGPDSRRRLSVRTCARPRAPCLLQRVAKG